MTNCPHRILPLLWPAILFFISINCASAELVRVAVASNFASTAKTIAAHFEKQSGHHTLLAFGSTGKLYAQIVNGAPFDAFLAADEKRPARLEAEGLSVPNSRFTYAIGRLLLWSPQEGYVDPRGAILRHKQPLSLAMANPKLAPYGRAAQETLQALGLWNMPNLRLIRGENIGQAFQFIQSGNLALGFIAASQVMRPDKPLTGSFWEVPDHLYSPIKQQAVQLHTGDAVTAFLAFLKNQKMRKLILSHGYQVP